MPILIPMSIFDRTSGIDVIFMPTLSSPEKDLGKMVFHNMNERQMTTLQIH